MYTIRYISDISDRNTGHLLFTWVTTWNEEIIVCISKSKIRWLSIIKRTNCREIIGGHTWFAPTTGILIQFTREGGPEEEGHEYTFRATITNTRKLYLIQTREHFSAINDLLFFALYRFSDDFLNTKPRFSKFFLATNHHCPYPFIDLHPDEIYWMPDTLIEYYCDAIVTAPPGIIPIHPTSFFNMEYLYSRIT